MSRTTLKVPWLAIAKTCLLVLQGRLLQYMFSSSAYIYFKGFTEIIKAYLKNKVQLKLLVSCNM